MQKSNTIEHPVAELIKNRKSVRAFLPTPIESEKIHTLFEATRWAPSSSNEQPWLYIYATKGQSELWDKLFATLNHGNQIWAKDSPLLIISLARKNYVRYGKNVYAMYDLGGANSFLSLQAVELGLQVRQMAGFNQEQLRISLNVPEDYEIGVMMAVGYPGDPETLPENLKLRETSPRERYLQEEFVMNKSF